MKKAINTLLSILSPLAAVPTGWAIYAGMEKIPAFPMKPFAAIIGAIAIIATSILTGLLVVDIYAYNQTMNNEAERVKLAMSPRNAWLVLVLCVLAEVTLTLLIVIIPDALLFGVLAFPLMTFAGVFATALRYSLAQRESIREQGRELAKAEAQAAQAKLEAEQAAAKAEIERAKAELKAERKQRQAEKRALELAKAKAEPATAEVKPESSQTEQKFFCKVPDCKGSPKTKDGSFGTQSALNAHGGKHKAKIIGYAVSMEPIKQEQTK